MNVKLTPEQAEQLNKLRAALELPDDSSPAVIIKAATARVERNAALAKGRALNESLARRRQATASATPLPKTAPPARLTPPVPQTKALAALAAAQPTLFPIAMRRSAPPAMFHSGAVPPAIASGQDPAILNRLPEEIRHYAAKANVAEFGRLVAEYADLPDADAKVDLMFETKALNDPGWVDYQARLRSWLYGS